jgi:hypothetical protein
VPRIALNILDGNAIAVPRGTCTPGDERLAGKEQSRFLKHRGRSDQDMVARKLRLRAPIGAAYPQSSKIVD